MRCGSLFTSAWRSARTASSPRSSPAATSTETNRAATLHVTDYGTPTGTAATVLHMLTL